MLLEREFFVAGATVSQSVFVNVVEFISYQIAFSECPLLNTLTTFTGKFYTHMFSWISKSWVAILRSFVAWRHPRLVTKAFLFWEVSVSVSLFLSRSLSIFHSTGAHLAHVSNLGLSVRCPISVVASLDIRWRSCDHSWLATLSGCCRLPTLSLLAASQVAAGQHA